jgi:general secretion pathway protein D
MNKPRGVILNLSFHAKRSSACAALLTLMVVLSACSTAPKPGSAAAAGMLNAPRAAQDSEIIIGAEAAPQAALEKSFPGTGQFVKPLPEEASGAGGELSNQEVTFNFEATPVPEVVKTILGDLLQQTYVIGPGVGGTVTFSTAKPIKGSQAMAVLEMLLSWNGAALVRKGDAYMVVQTQTAVPGNLAPQFTPPNMLPNDARGYTVRAVPLQFVSATQMDDLLKPYARQGSVLKADNARSLIVISGTRSELESYLKVIESFDVDWMAGMSFGMFTLERVEVKDILPELEAIFGDSQGTAGAGSSPISGMVRMLPIERLNAIMVITPQKQYLSQVETWIKRLDRGGSQSGARLYVYDVRNVKAIDLADRLNEVFTGQSAAPRQQNTGRGEVAPGLSGGTLSSGGRPSARQQPPIPAAPTPTPAASASGAQTGGGLLEGQDVRISAVEDTNSLLISATASQYDIIKSAIKRLDVEPLQVKIDARILEVSLNDRLTFGVSWFLERAISGTGGAIGATNPNLDRSIFGGLGGIVNGGGGSYTFSGPSAQAFVNFINTNTTSTTLSSPSLMVLNNKQASINVGQSISVQTAVINTGVVGGQSQNINQYIDTGLSLSITPRVNPGGLVYLEIEQEQSAPIGDATEANPNQSISQKTISTEVAVQSGQTILLGGLISTVDSGGSGGLPGLSKLPLIGGLFGNRSKTNARTETLVLITPTVVYGGADAMREVTDEYIREFKGLQPLIQAGVIPPAPISSEKKPEL